MICGVSSSEGGVGDPKTAAVVRWHYSMELFSTPANSVIVVTFLKQLLEKCPL